MAIDEANFAHIYPIVPHRWGRLNATEWLHAMPEQLLGEIELLRGGANIATIRAALDTGVELAALDGETFNSLIAESEPTKEEIAHVAQERTRENRAGRRG